MSKCPLTDEYIKKCGLFIQWNSVPPQKEILTHATMWMNLEDIVLNEISQA